MTEATFLDSSVMLHAFLKPKRKLTAVEEAVKRAAKNILAKIEDGEPVVTTVVHLGEVFNIVETRLGLQKCVGLAAWLLTLDNIEVLSVSADDYEAALPVAQRYSVSINDALAYVVMVGRGVNRAYSFDKHFKQLPGIEVLPKIQLT